MVLLALTFIPRLLSLPPQFCTPWFLGWYLRRFFRWDKPENRCDRGRYFPILVHGPWFIFMGALLLTAIILSFETGAYLLAGFVISYVLFLPAGFWAISRFFIMRIQNPQKRNKGRSLLDMALIILVSVGFFFSTSVAGRELGGVYVVGVLLCMCLLIGFYVPVIRDRDFPPPRTHEQCIAFHCKSVCYKVVQTARVGLFLSIFLLLSLILVMRTAPPNLTPPYSGKSLLPKNSTSLHSAGLPSSSSGPVPYPFCSYSIHGLSVLDMAYISYAAYLSPTSEVYDYVAENVQYPGNLDIKALNLTNVFGVRYAPTVYQLTDERAKLIIVAVRGTEEIFDFFQDLDVWSEAIMVQFASSLSPLYASPILQPFMDKFIGTAAHLVESLSILKNLLIHGGRATMPNRYYYDQLYSYMQDNVLNRPGIDRFKIIMTGHSLG